MNVNSSLDFLDMIKSSADKQKGKNIAESAGKTADQESTAALQKDSMRMADSKTIFHGSNVVVEKPQIIVSGGILGIGKVQVSYSSNSILHTKVIRINYFRKKL